MIKLEKVSKVYRNYEDELFALKEVDLEIKEGEFVAIVGTSGSGKSTLLNIIGAMDKSTEGNYYFNGIKVSSLNKTDFNNFRRDNISFVFQNFALMNRYTVYQNVELPLMAKGIKKRKKIVMDALEKLEIADLAKKTPLHLSGGQQQRCAIARAIVSDSKVILADEPTGALDSRTGEKVMEILESINRSGKTVIIITHDMNIANHCKRIIRIEDGKLYN